MRSYWLSRSVLLIWFRCVAAVDVTKFLLMPSLLTLMLITA